jgi:hypothetical protein
MHGTLRRVGMRCSRIITDLQPMNDEGEKEENDNMVETAVFVLGVLKGDGLWVRLAGKYKVPYYDGLIPLLSFVLLPGAPLLSVCSCSDTSFVVVRVVCACTVKGV